MGAGLFDGERSGRVARTARSASALRLTFAIPFCRGRDFLERAIQSALAQDDEAWELVVCDSGSEPDIEELVRAFGDERLRYLRSPDRQDGSDVADLSGMGRHYNLCLDVAATELVCVLHADDELGPAYRRSPKLTLMYRTLKCVVLGQLGDARRFLQLWRER